MTNDQLAVLAVAIAANQDWNDGLSQGPDVQRFTAEIIVGVMNEIASPPFWAFRTNVTRADIYHQQGPEGTSWSWQTYKAQNVAEQNAWVQMFMGDVADFSLPNLRAGVDAIFTGTGAAAAQRAHVHSIGRRQSTVAEKLLKKEGEGSTVSPAVMGFEGEVSIDDILQAWEIHVNG